jgi:polysaccharide export outer membrane protein
MRRNVILFLILTVGLIQTLFSQENVPATISQSTAPTTSARGYLLGPGDEIIVKVLGEKDFDFEAELDENGNIEVPFFDQPIAAMCKSERELRGDVSKLLGKYLRMPQVSLRVKERKSRPPTTVYGEVKMPQQFTLYRQARLMELLSQSGGVNDEAGGIVQVFRPQAPLCGSAEEIAEWKARVTDEQNVPSSIYTISSVLKGSDEANPIIYPGDIVVVEKAKPVYIIGEVSSPQGVYLKEDGLTLTEAISKVGGIGRETKVKEITIRRLKPNSKERESIAINWENVKKGEEKDPILEAYDIVEVNKAKKSVAQTIMELAIGGGRTAFQTLVTGVPNKVIY